MTNADIIAAVQSQFPGEFPPRIGIAVSGGGDSIALLHLMATCLKDAPTEIYAATVNHGLRAAAADEAGLVASLCQNWGIEHQTLHWVDWDQQGNLQAEARRARYQLLTEWAVDHQIPILALGHTADDQAETLLMGMARASGVSGLSAMPVRRSLNGITLFRPLLDITRADLRAYLEQHGVSWAEDPSNEDTRFERVRVRQALEVLEPLGLNAKVLARVAANVGRAREALDWYTFMAAKDLARTRTGAVTLEIRKFRTLPEETARRLLVRALNWVSSSDHPPRQQAVNEALSAIRSNRAITLNGCHIVCRGGIAWVCRELQAVRDCRSDPGAVWDGRWRFHGGRIDSGDVRPLGEAGLSTCPDWRGFGLPREVLLATPALWHGQDLVSAPLAGYGNGWTAELEFGEDEFFAVLLSH